ncbi:MAG: ATP-binding cassette domain-containing protein [Chloroflexi bacterium]|nr:ATP-binding cassette domain-containing protein [Chloroflexota bacterium]
MTNAVISVEHLTKQYDLGVIGTGTISRDLNRWWARVRKQPDPYTRIGQKDAFERIGDSILALDDVSFTVQQGEALGIIGRNGAGKSTLLKILSRVTAPSSGVVKVRGRIGSLLEVGTGFHPELTGRENVYLNGAILGMKKEEVTRKFNEIVDFSGVEKFIDTPVKRYSSGMYVRLAFAVAAHLDPEILIVDEVLAVGDAEFQKKCLGKMGDVTGEGRTVLFVSHNMAAIEKLCKTCLLLKDGNIEINGLTSDVVDKYLGGLGLNHSPKPLEDYRHSSSQKNIIQQISCLSVDLQQKTVFRIDENIILELKLSENITNRGDTFIGVGINNAKDERVFTLMSFNGIEQQSWQQGNLIRVMIPNNNLIPGPYFLKISVTQGGTEQDVILNFPAFEVASHDYFNSGRLPSHHQGLIIKDAYWEYHNAV